jgi:hypothetical protein
MAQLLVRAVSNGEWTKGTPVDTMDLPNYQGIILPEFILLDVTDATREQLSIYIDQWRADYKTTETAVGTIRSIQIAPEQAASGPEINQSEVLLGNIATGEVTERGRSNPDASVDADVQLENTVQALDSELNDKYWRLVQVRHWFFTEAFVDTVIGEGGTRVMTLAQLQAEVQDNYG